MDNFITKAESLAGTPGHGLLAGKARTKGAAVYHSASSILGPNPASMMSFGMGSMTGGSNAPLPFPSSSSYTKKGK